VRRVVERYGREPEQVGEWWLPAEPVGAPPVVLIHGGFWKPAYDRHLEDDVAAALVERGAAVWNVDYRAGTAGWPAPLHDVTAAVDAVRRSEHAAGLDLARLALVGHSAGGHLALWLASRVQAHVVVGQAPVADLVSAYREDLGDGAVARLTGASPDEAPDRYAYGSPREHVPITGPQVVLIHGDRDQEVPLRQSEEFVAADRAAGGRAQLRALGGIGHYEHLDPASAAGAELLATLERNGVLA
jgi:acetyl esterase/lipase